jgi:glycosyltransferase involved in cell wall biosynthesis
VVGDAGELVSPGDTAGLGQRLVALLQDSDRRVQLADAAAARVRRFDGSVVVAQYLAAYEEALARAG